eukprot:7259021-Prymnesium_polylepis.1
MARTLLGILPPVDPIRVCAARALPRLPSPAHASYGAAGQGSLASRRPTPRSRGHPAEDRLAL